MGLEKIADITADVCLNPEHDPPANVVLSPGVYRHTCPGCGSSFVFCVPLITC